MTNLRSILMSSAAAIGLAAAPALAQEATAPVEAPEAQQGAQVAQQRSYEETYGQSFAELGDRNVEELIGSNVVTDTGEEVGSIDNFGLSGESLVAIVGIGGFLGMGEHNVAMPLDRLTWDGEKLVISGVTREELEQMPAYDEAATQTFASDQTLRGGYEGGFGAGGMGSETQMTDATSADPAASEQAAEGETAVLTDSDTSAETSAEPQVAEAESTMEGEEQLTELEVESAEGEGAEMAEAPETAEEAAEEMAEAQEQQPAGEAEQMAEAEEPLTEEGSTDMAAGEEALTEEGSTTTAATEEPLTEEGSTETAATEAPLTEEGSTETAEVEQQPADSEQMAQAGESTVEGDQAEPLSTTDTAEAEADINPDPAVETETAEAEIVTEGATGGWSEEMNTIFGDIADRQVAELIGMDVAGADGEVIGQVDNFALQGESIVAIVGIGGFLGLGEHEVALELGDMTYDGERLVLSQMSEEQLREMPEYDETQANYLPQEQTLRGSYAE